VTGTDTTATTDLLALLDFDPAEGLRRAADLREQRWSSAAITQASERAMAEVAHWRWVAGRCGPYSDNGMEVLCGRGDSWPCPDLRVAVAAAVDYLGGAR
jgi:hypothetical protein